MPWLTVRTDRRTDGNRNTKEKDTERFRVVLTNNSIIITLADGMNTCRYNISCEFV